MSDIEEACVDGDGVPHFPDGWGRERQQEWVDAYNARMQAIAGEKNQLVPVRLPPEIPPGVKFVKFAPGAVQFVGDWTEQEKADWLAEWQEAQNAQWSHAVESGLTTEGE